MDLNRLGSTPGLRKFFTVTRSWPTWQISLGARIKLHRIRTFVHIAAPLGTEWSVNYREANNCTPTVGSARILLHNQLQRKQVSEPKACADWSLCHCLGLPLCRRLLAETQFQPLTVKQWEGAQTLCERRANGEPLQYILGEWDFCGISLEMKAPVFIPRPETEDLVDRLVTSLEDVNETLRILEVGCGSGGIGLALLSRLPNSLCLAIDIKQACVDLSNRNCARVQRKNNADSDTQLALHFQVDRPSLTNRYFACRHDIQAFSLNDVLPIIASRPLWSNLIDGFDLIVSNPPYVPSSTMRNIAKEIRCFEDPTALDGGYDGLEIVTAILKRASELIAPKTSTSPMCRGEIWMEVEDFHPILLEKQYSSVRTVESKIGSTCGGKGPNPGFEKSHVFKESFHDCFGRSRFVRFTS